jgi:hypothetical protein
VSGAPRGVGLAVGSGGGWLGDSAAGGDGVHATTAVAPASARSVRRR